MLVLLLHLIRRIRSRRRRRKEERINHLKQDQVGNLFGINDGINVTLFDVITWAKEEANSPYLRLEMYPPLNEDEVGKDDLLVWCSNLENNVAKILK
ncbi:hypothetical protein Tco_0136605, partial [Tanacetum coccineum]